MRTNAISELPVRYRGLDAGENGVLAAAEPGLKIAHVADSLEVGGAEMLVALLSRLHREAGHASSVHCLFAEGSLARQLQQEGFRVYVHGPLPGWRLARSLYRHFLRDVPGVVHCHNATATIWGAPAARLAGAGAVISTRHGLVRPPFPLRRELAFWLAARCCDRIVAVCEATARNLTVGCGSDPSKVVVLRNAAAPAPIGSREGAPMAKQGFLLIHVARLAWYKDQANLLRAVSLASQEVCDLSLWIVGDGPEWSALQALAATLGLQTRVRFLGQREDVGRLLAMADLFVLSSITEGLPISLLEAMAAGLPAVLTDVGGMREVAFLSGAAKVVPPGHPGALAQAIVEFATRRDQLRPLGERARLCYERHFTPQRMANDYLRLYEECSRQRNSS